MKVIILCGGQGTRLREETEYRPKPLVMVGNRPMLWHIMKLYSHYGYNDFVLCLGYKGEMIKNYFLNYDELAHDFTLHLGSGKKEVLHHQNTTPRWSITFADTGQSCETGSRIARIRQYIGDDEEFMLTYGDAVADVNLADLYKFHQERGKTVTVTGVQPPSPFGVMATNEGLVKAFTEKPQSEDWTNGGFFVCNNKIFDYLSSDGTTVFEQEPLKRLASEGELAIYHHRNFWHCVDTFKHLEGLNAYYKKGNRQWMIWEQKQNS